MSSNNTSINISWTPLSSTYETGASPIINYKVRTNQGSTINIWQDYITIDATLPNRYIITGLIPGETYTVRIVAANIFGYGPESQDFIVIAGEQPSKPAIVSTYNDYTNIRLEWTAPFNNYLPITSYETQIVSKVDGLFYDVCNNDEDLICRIPMSVIRTSFGYQLGQLPQFRTRAYNERGPGLYSELNTVGGLIETEPTKMNKPTRNQTLT